MFIMSVWKPDVELRTEAYDMGCFDELMHIREDMIQYLQDQRRKLQEELS